MEHEVFVPVPVASLRRTLADAARVARCVPGLQQDADAAAGPLAGRLKFRAGGHTITYRGALTLRVPEDGDTFSVTGKGVEARGAGSAELTLTIALAESDGGTTVTYSGSASGDGRIVDLDDAGAVAAAQRLLDRFTQQLVTETLAARDGAPVGEEPPSAGAATGTGASEGSVDASDDKTPDDETPDDETSGDRTSGQAVPDEATPDEATPDGTASDGQESGKPSPAEPQGGEPSPPEPPSIDGESLFDTPVPPPSLDPSAELEFTVPDEPPAEAAHARRTMIGRSTEEVDHAPPRGRYAPVPSPEAGAVGITLRWAAPAAALAIASAVVVGRALRRRRP
ncbi:SRPBCC domain-containing protein [Streptomyces sp. NBC_00178]|uniref:SRPBCC family protein n=1 Tax=Streptomyces sp. NBC_00178 TaxID=2975672 RepID=UPI002E2E2FA8|nr:SRPBCC domain-containing protein [Streptomyces sp. NBC_00178]